MVGGSAHPVGNASVSSLKGGAYPGGGAGPIRAEGRSLYGLRDVSRLRPEPRHAFQICLRSYFSRGDLKIQIEFQR